MESVKVKLTEKLKELYEQAESVGIILFVYNVEVPGYTGHITMPHDQAMMWTVPEFLKDVPAENIDIRLLQDVNQEALAVFMIQIRYTKQNNDPEEFNMEIKTSPASTFDVLEKML